MRLADPPRAHAPLRNRPADPQPRARCRRIEQPVRVKFTGGREVTGTLQGFDALVNLVLDDCVEYLRGARPPARSPARPPPVTFRPNETEQTSVLMLLTPGNKIFY